MTDAQSLLLNLLRGWMAITGGTAPTRREIADQLGYPSTGLVWRDLRALRDLGLIDCDHRHETSLRITGANNQILTERTNMGHHIKASRTGDRRNRCTAPDWDTEIRTRFQAGQSKNRICRDIGRSGRFINDRLAAMGLMEDREPEGRNDDPFVIQRRNDDRYVSACVEAGGFIYRTKVGGLLVEVRP